jgi:hypothetical protein
MRSTTMGYTHYWYRQIDVEVTDKQWKKITDFAHDLYVLELKQRLDLVWEYDKPDNTPEITRELIRFNGVGEAGHETFYFERNEQPEEGGRPTNEAFSFCKTARKHYDRAVCAMLLAAEFYAPRAWRIGSDGSKDEWVEGRHDFNQITQEPVPELECWTEE